MLNRRINLKTTITTLKKGSKKVIIAGVVHVGTTEYYEKVKSILEGVVIYEGIKKWEFPPIYTLLAGLLNLSMQSSVLPIQENWVHADISGAILKQIHKTEELKKTINDATEKLSGLPEESRTIVGRIVSSLVGPSIFLKKFSMMLSPVVYVRNYLPIIRTLQLLYDDNVDAVSILFGDGHRYHITKTLKKCGFRVIKKEKIKAF